MSQDHVVPPKRGLTTEKENEGPDLPVKAGKLDITLTVHSTLEEETSASAKMDKSPKQDNDSVKAEDVEMETGSDSPQGPRTPRGPHTPLGPHSPLTPPPDTDDVNVAADSIAADLRDDVMQIHDDTDDEMDRTWESSDCDLPTVDEPTRRPFADLTPATWVRAASDNNAVLDGKMMLETSDQQENQPLQPVGYKPHDKENYNDTAMDVDSQAEDDAFNRYAPEGLLRLDIDRFTEFSTASADVGQRLSKPIFVRGLPWRILAMPRDCTVKDATLVYCRDATRAQFSRPQKALGFFLQCNGDAEQATWSCTATATLKVLSQCGGEDHTRRISHPFNPKENDWGYSQFLSCDNLLNPEAGYILNDTIRLEVLVSADAPHGVQWDSKKHAGHVGLKNQGATCYMNSILQAFFFTNQLRKAVYEMPMSIESIDQNVGLAMQRVFFDLQHSDKPVGTKKLTKSFGWDTMETFMQHDVQELCRVLLDNLESKMKGTSVEDTIPSLFRGRMKSYIKCLEVNFESSRVEDFYDIQLNIKGKRNIIDSFKEYTAVERLDGANKYDAGEHGLQPAEKGVKFVVLPPVLHLQLMRFQYDGMEQKINDRFEFPQELDLFDFTDNVEREECLYRLHAVLVHSGDFHGGHYVAFINTSLHQTYDKPNVKSKWCKFDDDVVSQATVRDAVMANYGGDDNDVPARAFTNAYMLVYVKTKAIPTVLSPISDDEIPKRLVDIFNNERDEEVRKKKERLEAHLYTELTLVLPDMVLGHHGFDLIDPKKIEERGTKEKFEKAITVNEFYEQMKYRLFGGIVEPMKFRVWRFTESESVKKDNHQQLMHFRPSTLINEVNANKMIDTFFEGDKYAVYIEAPIETNQYYDDARHMLVFVKFYEPSVRKLTLIGSLIMNISKTFLDYQEDLCDLVRLPPRTQLHIFEECSPDQIRYVPTQDVPICTEGCLQEFKDGAILVVQNAQCHLPGQSAKVFMEEMYGTIECDVIMHEVFNNHRPAQAPFPAQICLTWTLSNLVKFIGESIDYDQAKILLWQVSPFNDRPTQYVTQSHYDVYAVRDLLGLSGPQMHDPRKNKKYRVYYSKMPHRVDEMDRRRQIKLLMLDNKMNISDITVWPERTGKVSHILEEARREFKFAPGGTGKLRLVYCGQASTSLRVYLIFNEDSSVDEVAQKTLTPAMYMARVEEIPEDQLVIKSNECLCPVAHFDRDPSKMFGVPFYIKVSNEEPLSSVRDRIRLKLDVPEKEFEKYKFALIAQNRIVRYLDMQSGGQVNLAELGCNQMTMGTTQYLGIEHMNKRSSRNLHLTEKAIRIHN